MGRCVSFETNRYLCNMNETKITYVPASKQGPHYVGAGLRPDCGESDMLTVVVQLQNGARHCAVYAKDTDTFASLAVPAVTFRDVVCWHHLPGEEPELEREWFDAAGPSKGYSTDRWRVGQEWEYRAELMRPDGAGPAWYGEFRKTLDEAVTDAYNHWVVAGRP